MDVKPCDVAEKYMFTKIRHLEVSNTVIYEDQSENKFIGLCILS